MATEALSTASNEGNTGWVQRSITKRFKILRHQKQYAQAEALLFETFKLSFAQARSYAKLSGYSESLMIAFYLRSSLPELIGVYADLGRWEDIKALLDDFPYWGVGDIADVLVSKDSLEMPLGIYVARALSALGDNEGAAEHSG